MTNTRIHNLSLVSAICIWLTIASPTWGSSPCTLDQDNSGAVDFGDLALVLLDYGPCESCVTDVDASGIVDFGDVALTLLDFGPCQGWFEILEHSPDPAVIYDSALRAAIESVGLPWRVRDRISGIEMVLIPPGTFMMGCTASDDMQNCFSDEYPVHQVTLTKAFYLSRTEITQTQWASQMGPYPGPDPDDLTPVEVRWPEAANFCSITGLRLPSEAEWEYACRAGTSTAFHGWGAKPLGSNDAGDLAAIAWYSESGVGGSGLQRVGLKGANGFGLHDVLGNAWEWVHDWKGRYPESPQIDPVGPGPGTRFEKLKRGGSSSLQADFCRVSYRNYSPDGASGFRVARTP